MPDRVIARSRLPNARLICENICFPCICLFFSLFVILLVGIAKGNPTGPFTILDPKYQEIGTIYVAQENRATWFKVLKLRKGRSGRQIESGSLNSRKTFSIYEIRRFEKKKKEAVFPVMLRAKGGNMGELPDRIFLNFIAFKSGDRRL